MTRAQGKEAEKITESEQLQEGGKENVTKPKPAYCFKPKLQNPEVAQNICQRILEMEVPKITVKELLTISSDLWRLMINVSATHKVPTTSAVVAGVPELSIEFSTPLQEVEVVIHRQEGKEIRKWGSQMKGRR
jgi:hypothetical protein